MRVSCDFQHLLQRQHTSSCIAPHCAPPKPGLSSVVATLLNIVAAHHNKCCCNQRTYVVIVIVATKDTHSFVPSSSTPHHRSAPQPPINPTILIKPDQAQCPIVYDNDYAQAECNVALNAVDSVDAFLADVTAGRWDLVLPQVAHLRLPTAKLYDLYEQVVLEMVELRETDTARIMLRTMRLFHRLKQDDPERFLRLDKLCQQCAPLLCRLAATVLAVATLLPLRFARRCCGCGRSCQ